jgi:nucleoside 2-deoxyribosyltransferase
LADPAEYTAWDLHAIRKCDLVLAYLEESNPGGPNVALELGYAHALGKPIILVNEKKSRITSMLDQIADHVTGTLDDAIGILGRLVYR